MVIALAISALLVLTTQAAQIHYGLNIWDEGFLWYGVQRVWANEVPIRDFMAYDPGRYYWVAAVEGIWSGRSIIDIRIAVAIFQMAGLCVGLTLISAQAGTRRLPYITCAGVILVLWMFPRHKLFDIALSLMLTGLVAWLLAVPNVRRSFVTGVLLGGTACFGRNHGIYGLIGVIIAFGIIFAKDRAAWSWRMPIAWIGGMGIGFAPIGMACLFVPGFARAFWESIVFLFEMKQTNLPLAIPWPWTVNYGELDHIEALRQSMIGCLFIALLAFPIATAFIVLRARGNYRLHASLLATVCMSIPYAHYAFSRADVGHLAQAIFPLLLGTLILLLRLPVVARWWATFALLMVTVLISMPSHPRIACGLASVPCQKIDAGGATLTVSETVAFDVELVHDLAARYATKGEAFVTAPYWAGAYALEGVRSPLWEIYATSPRSDAFQRREITRLEKARPGFVILMDFPLDNREELRYRNTHPLMFKYFQENFQPLPSRNPNYLLFKAYE